VYKVQVDSVVRDADESETLAIDNAKTQYEATQQAAVAAVDAKNRALAKLAALGLTEAEITALVG
jgi:hypothetical protein